ncbi:hypothetical protein J7K93_05175 [bacterium]|nr:hypothetical protein [bacterium]
MKTQSIDTDENAERALISLIRSQSFSKKLFQVFSFSQTAMQLSKRAISRSNKDSDINQLKLRFIKYNYGEDLAEKVRKCMDEINNAKI